jgi:dipeptidyl aminopeptidase/acylaminoacyl peptidase
MFKLASLAALCLLSCLFTRAQTAPTPLGLFEGQGDIGNVLHPGSATYDDGSKTYTVSGSGENMWFAKDEFYFVWTKVSALELNLTANISVLGSGGDGHRKGVLMIRQSLDANSAYVDVARHGEGLTSLQFREKKGDITHEIESNVSGPAAMRIEKRGNLFYLWVGSDANNLDFAGGSAWVEMRPPFYVGIGVCSHAKDAVEKFSFSNVELDTKPKHSKGKIKFSNLRFSTIETVLLSGDARTAYVSQKHLISPGWSADGKIITFQTETDQFQTAFVPLKTAAPVGDPLPALTGVDFSYFTTKIGKITQIWRKSADGSQSVQFTPDDFNNTSPHVSPDGKYLLFLSYSKEYDKLSDDTPVELRLMLLKDSSIKTLVTFVGGPGSLGDQPWSPDGRRIVFISYQPMK